MSLTKSPHMILFTVLLTVAATAQTYDLTERYRPQQVLVAKHKFVMAVEATADDPEVQKALEGGFDFREDVEARYRVMKVDGDAATEVRAFVSRAAELSTEPGAEAEQTDSSMVGKTVVITFDKNDEPLYATQQGNRLKPEQVVPFSSDVPGNVLEGLEVNAAKIGDEWVQKKDASKLEMVDLRYRFVEVVTQDDRNLARLELTLAGEAADLGDDLKLMDIKGTYLFDLDRHLPYRLDAEGAVKGTVDLGEGAEATMSGTVKIMFRVEELAGE